MEVTVAPGTKIIWTNKDETPHTVTGEMVFPMHIDRSRAMASHGSENATVSNDDR